MQIKQAHGLLLSNHKIPGNYASFSDAKEPWTSIMTHKDDSMVKLILSTHKRGAESFSRSHLSICHWLSIAFV